MIKLNKEAKTLVIPSNIGNSNTQEVIGYTDEEMKKKYEEGYEKGYDDALEGIKIPVRTIRFSQYATYEDINRTLKCIDFSVTEYTNDMFTHMTLKDLDLSLINLSRENVSCSNMFQFATIVGSSDFTKFDTKNVNNFNAMFNTFTYKGGTLDCSHMSTQSLRYCDSMFRSVNVDTLILDNLDLSKSTNLRDFLYAVKGLNNFSMKNAKLPDINYEKNCFFGYLHYIRNTFKVSWIEDIFNCLPITTTAGRYIKLEGEIYDKLSQEIKNIAINKGWEVIRG